MDKSRTRALLVKSVQDLESRISKDGTAGIDRQSDGHRVGGEKGVRDCRRGFVRKSQPPLKKVNVRA